MFGRESHRLRVAVVPGSPVRFASWHPWNMRWLQRWGTPLGCWGSPFGTNGPFTSSLGIIIITKMLETIYKYIYITWNTSIKYAIIIDVVHVHNIIILIHIIYLHLKPPSSSWCISYIYIYDLSWFDFDLPWMPSDPSNNQTDRLILGELRGVENLKAVLPVVASKWCGVKSLRFKEWFTLR